MGAAIAVARSAATARRGAVSAAIVKVSVSPFPPLAARTRYFPVDVCWLKLAYTLRSELVVGSTTTVTTELAEILVAERNRRNSPSEAVPVLAVPLVGSTCVASATEQSDPI